jgi:hypothetical protein
MGFVNWRLDLAQSQFLRKERMAKKNLEEKGVSPWAGGIRIIILRRDRQALGMA